jgi:hypothetical protein
LAVEGGALGVLAAILTATGPALGASQSANTNAASGGTAIGDVDALHYLIGGNVTVPADSAGSNAIKCPAGMYPVGGGPSSPNAVWDLQWSDPDRSTPTATHPNEWTVGLFNTSGSPAVFKVFVVCATASSVKG